jgi:hypothetical protein
MSKGNAVDIPNLNEAPPLYKRDGFRLISIMIIVLGVWGGAWLFIDNYINIGSTDIDKFAARGQFGDKFGAVNALFAGLAFAGIIFTIFLQSREIKQTKTMLEEQLKDSNKQRFDSTFFQLLNLHNEITSKLSDTENKGREAFSSFHDRVVLSDRDYSCYAALQKLERDEIFRIKASSLIEDSIKAKLNNADISNIETSLEAGTASIESFLDNTMTSHETKIKNAYTVAAEVHVDKYSHYFRNLYHTLKFIKESPLIDESERAQYSKYLRSQLTEPELICLFYNSLTKIELPGREDMELGHPKMGKLLRHYDILQNLPPRRLLHPTHLTIFKTRNSGV